MWISADPGLCQSRGGAWDHRRCRTWLSGRKQRHAPSRQHLCQLHAPAIYMPLPFARPQTLQTLRRPPRQQLLQLHAPAICFSGGSRLSYSYMSLPSVFQEVQDCRLPGLNPPNASAGLQGNNSYSYMPLPSVFQGVQDCRLPGLKPPKRFRPFRRPPRQQLLQLYTCPCHLFFRGFKTAVCPASNPPNASNPSAGGFKTAVCPPSHPPNASAGFQGNNSYSYIHAPAICFSGCSRLPFARPQTPQTLPTLPQASKATTLTATCPCHLFFRGSRLPFARPQTPQTLPTLPQASKATTLTATCPCHLFFKGFKTAVCLASNPPNASAGLQGNNSYSYMPLPSVFQGVHKTVLQLHAPAICFSGGSRLPFARPQPSKRFRRPPRQQLLQLHAPAICFSGGSRLPFARPQTPQTLPTLPQASKATTLTAIYMPLPSVFQGVQDCRLPGLKPPKRFQDPFPAGLQGNNSYSIHAPAIYFSRGSRLPFAWPQTLQTLSAGLQGNNSYSYMPLPSVFQGVQDCRLPGLKPPKRFQPSRRPPRQQLLQLHAPAIYFSRGSRLPFAWPQTLQTLPQASKATTLTATCPCHLFFRGFKTAVCPASNPPNASNPSAGLQGNNSYSYIYMPLPSVFQKVQDCRLPGLKPSKRFRRPWRQQLLQLHAPAICFSGGSRLPFAWPQTLQTLPTLPQASKATTLTATCPCHLFFRGFKTAVCPASNSYFSRGSRLPFAWPQTLQTLPQASKATTLTATCPCHLFFRGFKTAVCPASNSYFSRGSRLPFAWPQTLQTLPQASKATTLTATCPCHLFFRGFKTAVCPASNPPNASNPPAGLQGNNSYSYMPLPSVFPGVQDCRLPGLKPSKPFRSPARQQLLQLHAPAICFSGGAWATRACDSPSLMGLPVVARTILFSCMVSQQACHGWRESAQTNGMTTQQFDTPGTSGHGAASFCWHGAPMVYSPRSGVPWRFPIAGHMYT